MNEHDYVIEDDGGPGDLRRYRYNCRCGQACAWNLSGTDVKVLHAAHVIECNSERERRAWSRGYAAAIAAMLRSGESWSNVYKLMTADGITYESLVRDEVAPFDLDRISDARGMARA
jgi:hypothetical protein